MHWNHLIHLRPRPDGLHIGQGHTQLATRADGTLDGGPDRGLFVHQTRVLSTWRYVIDDAQPVPVAVSSVEQDCALGYYVHVVGKLRPDAARVTSAKDVVELKVARFVGDGLRERIVLENFARERVRLTFQIVVDADFADMKETKSKRKQTGRLERDFARVDDGVFELDFDYHAEHNWEHQGRSGHAEIDRGLTLRIASQTPPDYDRGRLTFSVDLKPHERWTADLGFRPRIDGEVFEPPAEPVDFETASADRWGRFRRAYEANSGRVETLGPNTLPYVVQHAVDRARLDLRALCMEPPAPEGRGWVPSAGVPIYTNLFGRDPLTAAWQGAMFDTEMLDGILGRLADTQATGDYAWRDEKPGRLLHEGSKGPLKALNYSPLGQYYGTMTAPAFYPVALLELWHWTGDRERVRPYLETMLDALDWLDEEAPKIDGFYAYKTRSKQGVKNQAWKDSKDAIVYADGRLVEDPIATCEEQGFVYMGKLAAAALCFWFDRKSEAKQHFEQAQTLKKRFNDRFWDSELGFIAMGLDPDGKPIGSVGSNPGHCIATGIVDERLVGQVAGRLIADDMFSGWGIRTLSSEHAAYNPYSYHRGSVWPVENGTFALGFMRYGLRQHVHKLCRAMFEAASLFEAHRLPEVFSGHARDAEHPFPALYPKANSPQAWSASATACFVQAMTGVYPYAPLDALLVDPDLPAWLPELRVRDLQVGQARLDLRFWRDDDGKTQYAVEEKAGTVHVVRQPSPWTLTASPAERVKGAIQSLLPNH